MSNNKNDNIIIENEDGDIIFSVTQTEEYKKEKEKARKFYERRKKSIIRKRRSNTIRSIFYIIFGGLYSAIIAVCLGISYCATIIGIPFGIAYFKSIKLMFNPIDKRVVLHYGKHPILNTIWLLTGGLVIYMFYDVIGLMLCLTGVFYFSGKQYFKFAKYFLAPFGADTISRYEFCSEYEKKKYYTYLYIKRNNVNLLDKEIILTNNLKLKSSERQIKHAFSYSFWNNNKKNLISFFKILFISIIFNAGMIFYLLLLTKDNGLQIDSFFQPGSPKFLELIYIILALIIFNAIYTILFISLIWFNTLARGFNYGYANVIDIIEEISGKPIFRDLHLTKTVSEACMKYYSKHSNEIDIFISQEYVY